MGDVYKAMNRARQKPAAGPDDPGQQTTGETAPDGPRPETGGLPLDEVEPGTTDQAASGGGDADAFAADGGTAEGEGGSAVAGQPQSEAPVYRAHQRSRDEHVGAMAHHTRTKRDGSLNGYSSVVVAHHDRGSIITEQYRSIRTQILARARNRRTQVHTVTSAIPGEGKTVTSINLGVAFSELRDKRTLIIEGDLRKPSFEGIFDRECPHGLSDYLSGRTDDISEVLHPTVYENLQFIPAGYIRGDQSTEMLADPRMAKLIDRLRDEYDQIFIDSPPVINVTDACILGALSDQVILVVRLNRTPTDVIDRTKRLLKASNCEVGGVVLTHQTERTASYDYRYEGYYRSRK